jgi:phenylalanyl-tRNA synthetase beta chain
VNNNANNIAVKEKIATYLTGLGFYEIFTNSITNSKYYDEAGAESTVKMINNLSADLDVLRPSMLQTGLEVISHNINRKNTNLRLFELGKVYATSGVGNYTEDKHLAVYVCGNITQTGWQQKAVKGNFYYLKAVCERIFASLGIGKPSFEGVQNNTLENGTEIKIRNKVVGIAGSIHPKTLGAFDIKEPVFYADIYWDELLVLISNKINYKEITKFPAVERDLALIVDKKTVYAEIEAAAASAKIGHLQSVKLFDIFESEKLGTGKKSMAVNFTFQDETKTLTDKEIDGFMNKLIGAFEKSVGAEIRK